MFYIGFGHNRLSPETEQCIRELYGEQLQDKAVTMDFPAFLHIALEEKALQTKTQAEYVRFLIARDEVIETDYSDVCIKLFNMEELS